MVFTSLLVIGRENQADYFLVMEQTCKVLDNQSLALAGLTLGVELSVHFDSVTALNEGVGAVVNGNLAQSVFGLVNADAGLS